MEEVKKSAFSLSLEENLSQEVRSSTPSLPSLPPPSPSSPLLSSFSEMTFYHSSRRRSRTTKASKI
jgi:hypothetical protein